MTSKTGWSGVRSLLLTARLAGALNIFSGVPDGFAVSVVRKLVVRGDATTTAANILASEGLFRRAIVADLVAIVIFVASAVLLYDIFRPASRRLALLYLVLISMGGVIQALVSLQDLAALVLIKGGAGLSALPSGQAAALAFVFLRLHSFNYQLALVFDGFSSLVMCYLVLRSTFVPRIAGPFIMIDGLGFIIFGLGAFLYPPFAMRLYPYVPFATAIIGEVPLYLWLIIKGVNVERWREQAAAMEPALAA